MFAHQRTPSRLLWLAALVVLFATAANIALARTPLKFDEFGKLSCSDELIRLDNYGNKLRTLPDALAVVVVYASRSGTRRGEVVARLFAIRDFLVRRSSIETKRIVILDGGFRENSSVELWIIPSEGRESVRYLVTSDVSPSSVQLRGPALTKWQYKCDRRLR
jgi:hypothetical protein